MSSPSLLVRKNAHETSWRWLTAIMLLSQLLPEYIAPVLTLVGFLVMKRSFKKHGQKVRMDKFGKYEMIFMVFYLATFLYSDTKIYSILIALLWMGMFLGQLMLANLVDTKERLEKVLLLFVYSGSLSAAIGLLQSFFFLLKKYELLPVALPNPLSAPLDNAIFNFLSDTLGLKMVMTTFQTRACGTFNNPNIFAAFLVVVLPIAFYYFLNGKTPADKATYGFLSLIIVAGAASSGTRSALLAMGISVVFMLFTDKDYFKRGFAIVLAAAVAVIPFAASRQKALQQEEKTKFSLFSVLGETISINVDKSTATHLQIYVSLLEHIFTHPMVFLFGLGAGVNNVWAVLKDGYGINQPHAHNLIIELWAESGLVGLVLFAIAGFILLYNLITVIRRSKKGRKYAFMILSALLGFFVMNMTDYAISSPKILQVMFILLGLSQAIYRIFLGRWASQEVVQAKKVDICASEDAIMICEEETLLKDLRENAKADLKIQEDQELESLENRAIHE